MPLPLSLQFKLAALADEPDLVCTILEKLRQDKFYKMMRTCKGMNDFIERYKNSMKRNILRGKVLNLQSIKNCRCMQFGETKVQFYAQKNDEDKAMKDRAFSAEFDMTKIKAPSRKKGQSHILPLQAFIDVLYGAAPSAIYLSDQGSYQDELNILKKANITTNMIKLNIMKRSDVQMNYLEHFKPKVLTIYYASNAVDKLNAFLNDPILDTIETLNIKQNHTGFGTPRNVNIDIEKVIKSVSNLYLGNQQSLNMQVIRSAIKNWYEGKNKKMKKMTIKGFGDTYSLEEFIRQIPNHIFTAKVYDENSNRKLYYSRRADEQTAVFYLLNGTFHFIQQDK